MEKILKIFEYIFVAVSFASICTLFVMDEDSAVNIMLIWAYILMGVSVAVLIIMPTINIVKNPKSAIRTLIGLVGVAIVCAVLYTFSSDVPVVNSGGGFFDDPTTLKLTDMSLYIAYFTMAVSMVVVLYGEIRNSFK